MLPLYATLRHVFLPLIRHIFATFVVSESLQLVPGLLLCPSMKELKSIKGLAFLPKKVNAPEAGHIINKADPVPEARLSRNGQRAMKVRMHQFQELRATSTSMAEREAFLLSIETRDTKGRLSREFYSERINQVLFSKPCKSIMPEMAKTFMPDLIGNG